MLVNHHGNGDLCRAEPQPPGEDVLELTARIVSAHALLVSVGPETRRHLTDFGVEVTNMWVTSMYDKSWCAAWT